MALNAAQVTAVDAQIDVKLAAFAPQAVDIDSFWLITNGMFVFLMQIGFMLLEVGCVRAQHAKAICVKNAVDFLVATIFWLIIGYPLAFGNSGDTGRGGGCGGKDCALGHFAGQDYYFGDKVSPTDTSWAMWFFQWSFASATCTIVSGSGAERCSFQGYLISTMCLASFVYPCVVHWGWSGDAWLLDGCTFERTSGACDGLQFFDFAGSGIVHLTGGVVAFCLAAIVGPRDGRFSEDGKVNLLQPHNLVLSCSGGLLLVLGWFGFNGGSVLAASGGNSSLAGRVCAITAVGAATGGLSAFGIVFIQSRFINLEALMNGMLAGCVSVTAGASVLHPLGSVLSGIIGGLVYTGASRTLLAMKVDDPLDASPIHGVCGVWGCCAVGLFAKESGNYGPLGWFYATDFETGGRQFGYQLFGCLIIATWSAGVMSTIFSCMKAYSQSLIRVPLDIELSGDIILYGGSAYPQFSSEAQPPEGEMAVVITDVQGSTSLWEWDTDVMKLSVSLHEKILRDNTVRHNGFEIMDEGDSLTIAFHNGFDAVKFALVSTLDLFNAEWPEELYDHPAAAKEDDIYAGLRVRMGVDVGFGNKFLNRVTNRISYNGEVVDGCTALLKAVDDGGIVVTTTKCIQQLQGSFSHRLYEFGDIHMQDVGTYKMEGIDEPVPCIQIMPEAFKDRPPTSLSGCTMTMRGFGQAPGVATDVEEPISLIFMTLSAKGGKERRMSEAGGPVDGGEGGDDDETMKLCIKIVSEAALACEGYVTKTSNGVSLLAFPTPDDGMRFIVAVRSAIESEGQLKFCAGLHTGVVNSVAPNKASGRADYLGPPVNCSARLLSLASEDSQFNQGQCSIAVGVDSYTGLTVSEKDSLSSAGEFQLKGIGDKVEAYKF